MKTINKPSDNLGGLIKIWAIPSNVFSITGKNIFISDLTNVYQIYCSPESMDFKEPIQNDGSGNHYKPSLTGFVPKDTEDSLKDISYIEQRLWAIVFMDGNGSFKVTGNQHEPVKVSFVVDTKKQTSQRAGYSLRVYGSTTSRASFVNNPF